MYPANFEYFAPTTLDEALEILERYGDEGKVLAGGMSLIPVMKLRIASTGSRAWTGSLRTATYASVRSSDTRRPSARSC